MKIHQATEGPHAMSNEPNPLSSGQEPSQRRFLRHAFERAQAGLKAAWDRVPTFYRTALVTVAPGTLGLAATALGVPLEAVVGTQGGFGLIGVICIRSGGIAAGAAAAGGLAAVAGDLVALGSLFTGFSAAVAALAVAVGAAAAATDAMRAGSQNPKKAAAGAGLGSLVGSIVMVWAGYAYAPDSLKKAPAAKAPVVSSTFPIEAKDPACAGLRIGEPVVLNNGEMNYVLTVPPDCKLAIK